MARFVQPVEKHHSLKLRSDGNKGEILLVGGGRGSYLWAGQDDGACVTFSGPQILRRLAKEILKHVPERRRASKDGRK